MKSLLFLASVFVSSIASADVINCTFTEPFVSTIYDMKASSFTILNPFPDARSGKSTTEKFVAIRLAEGGVFELVSKNGEVIQTLRFNGKGSDGMSDRVYPIDVEWKTPLSSNGKLFGGCVLHRVK